MPTPTPTGPDPKEAFVEGLRPLVRHLEGMPIDDPDATRELLAQFLPFDGPLVRGIRDAALAAQDEPWLLPRENQGVRFGRLAKDLHGLSIDVVRMSGPGPRHRHPNGEIDLCIALDGEPRFDGQPAGWVVYGPGSAHVPTVSGGTMLILYFLPRGAIEWL